MLNSWLSVTNRCAVGNFLYGLYWTRTPNRLISEIFSIKRSRHTDRHRHVDWQYGSLKA